MCIWACRGFADLYGVDLGVLVLVKEGGGDNGEKGWLGGRWGVRGAGIAPSLCWWQKCRRCLPTRPAHCSASHFSALYPSALTVNLETGGLWRAGCAAQAPRLQRTCTTAALPLVQSQLRDRV